VSVKTSAKGRSFIEAHEGLRLRAYKPVAAEQYWSCCYGHYGPDVKPGVTYTLTQCRLFLKGDLESSEEAVATALAHFAENVKQQEIDALVSGVYNMGPRWVLDPSYSTLAKRLASPEAKTFTGRCRIYRDEFKRWVKGANGETLPGLVQRREDEKRLACRGNYGL
jgi:lysozyme